MREVNRQHRTRASTAAIPHLKPPNEWSTHAHRNRSNDAKGGLKHTIDAKKNATDATHARGTPPPWHTPTHACEL